MSQSLLPRQCPECGRVFSSIRRPVQRMPFKGHVIMGIGAVMTVALLIGVIALIGTMKFTFLAKGPAALGILGFTVLGPSLLAGKIALSLPRVATVRCQKCGWKDSFTIPKRGRSKASAEQDST